MQTQKKGQERVALYIPTSLLRQLRSVLVLRGESLSAWFRKKASSEVDGASTKRGSK